MGSAFFAGKGLGILGIISEGGFEGINRDVFCRCETVVRDE